MMAETVFTIMTYNVANGLAIPERLIPQLMSSKADIVGLQELSPPQAWAIEEQLFNEFPFQALFPGEFWGKGLISRHPIIDVEQLFLFPGRPDLRGAIDLAGYTLAVILAHPPPPHLSLSGIRFAPKALDQIQSLVKIAASNPPSILMGDFNMTYRHAVHAQIRASGLADAFHVIGKGGGYTLPVRLGPWRRMKRLNRLLRWLPMLPLARVDYIWHSSQLQPQAVWLGEDGGSDHLPVLARMVMQEP
jgi:vancomycin resistance protein VanJ